MTDDQARHIYKKVESESIIDVETIKQGIEADKLDNNNNFDEDEVNPCQEIIVNKIEKEDIITLHMEQWSILSNVVNYVQYDRNPRSSYDLDIKTVDQKSHKKIYGKSKEEKRHILELDFGNTPEKLRGDYLNMYKGIQTEVKSTTRCQNVRYYLDTGASKSFMSKSHYLWCKPLHSLTKFASKIQRIQVGKLASCSSYQ